MSTHTIMDPLLNQSTWTILQALKCCLGILQTLIHPTLPFRVNLHSLEQNIGPVSQIPIPMFLNKVRHFYVVPWHQYYCSGRPPGIQRLFMQSVPNCLIWYMMTSGPLKVILEVSCCHKAVPESISRQIVILMSNNHPFMTCSRHSGIRMSFLVPLY